MSVSERDFEFVASLVREQSAIVLDPSKAYLVESRLTGLVRERGAESIEALVAAARGPRGEETRTAIIDAMTTNETYFLRDFHPFELMRSDVIPALLEEHATDRKLQIWCAASSSGQEPYTIAMTLREHFPQLLDWTIGFIASDISSGMLCKAREGVYTQLEVNRGLPAPMLIKYFQRVDNGWKIKDDIRAMIDFQKINLAANWPPMPPVDIVFLRNVLIYFDTPTKQEVLRKVRERLNPKGVLFLGGAETTLNLDDGFERVQVGKSGYYRLR